jgi:c-di-GMP-binding flagellar brake protein YcgR
VKTNRKSNDRRVASRFPIERDLRYKVVSKKSSNEQGGGSTLNISSSGILFTTEQTLIPGRTVEIAINWPANLDDSTPLKLVARGRIVRSDLRRAAIQIQRYEFRTQARGSELRTV